MIYLKAGRVIALDCVNRVRDYVQGRALVVGSVHADSTSLADPTIDLKTIRAEDEVVLDFKQPRS